MNKKALLDQLINGYYTNKSEYEELKEYIKYLNNLFDNYKNHE